MPTKDFNDMKKIIKKIHKHRENPEDPFYDGVPLIVLTNTVKKGLHQTYLLAKQATLMDKTIKYKEGRVFFDGEKETE